MSILNSFLLPKSLLNILLKRMPIINKMYYIAIGIGIGSISIDVYVYRLIWCLMNRSDKISGIQDLLILIISNIQELTKITDISSCLRSDIILNHDIRYLFHIVFDMRKSFSAEIGFRQHSFSMEYIRIINMTTSPLQSAFVLLSHWISLE